MRQKMKLGSQTTGYKKCRVKQVAAGCYNFLYICMHLIQKYSLLSSLQNELYKAFMLSGFQQIGVAIQQTRIKKHNAVVRCL